MKKAIILGMALVASLNVVSAANAKASASTNSTALTISHTNSTDPFKEIPFVSFADPSLITAELGSLKKSPITTEEIIASDNKVIESVPVKTVVLKLKKKALNPVVKLKVKLVN